MGSGLLLVRRVWADPTMIASAKRPGVSAPVQEVGRPYRGIDGQPWPAPANSDLTISLVAGLAGIELLDVVRTYRDANCALDCDLIYIAGPDSRAIPPIGFTFLGFDFGYYESETSVYLGRLFQTILHVARDFVPVISLPMRSRAQLAAENLLM